MAGLTFTVDDSEVMHALHQHTDAVGKLVGEVAEELAADVADEAGRVQDKLGAAWKITGAGPISRTVEAPEWWAHFFDGGTADHGPRYASRLVFAIDGQIIRPMQVRGLPAADFSGKAMGSTEHRLDDIIRRLIGGL